MHISEGIITGAPAAAYTALSLGLVGYGAKKMKDFTRENPEKKTMLGMAGAFIFFLSLIPLPAFTGSCSHPCGSPLVGILLGPWIGIALSGLSLLLQAAFFAHGGFSTWGANVILLGVGGAFFGWLTFKIAIKLKLPFIASAALGGLIGDIMTYLIAGLSLGTILSISPEAKYSLTGYLSAIYIAYIPTQLPIAIGEMFLTGWIFNYVYKQRADILLSLKVITAKTTIIFLFTSIVILSVGQLYANLNKNIDKIDNKIVATENAESEKNMTGMDEAVNEKMAEEAGKSPRDPYINLESLGDAWNGILMLAAGLCGFIIGRGTEKYFGKKS